MLREGDEAFPTWPDIYADDLNTMDIYRQNSCIQVFGTHGKQTVIWQRLHKYSALQQMLSSRRSFSKLPCPGLVRGATQLCEVSLTRVLSSKWEPQAVLKFIAISTLLFSKLSASVWYMQT